MISENLILENKNLDLENRNLDLENKNLELENTILDLEKKNYDLESRNLDWESKNLDLEDRCLELENIVLDLEDKNLELKKENANLLQEVLNRDGHIELLLEVERKYEHEKTTHAYKLVKKLQRAANGIIPLDSRRRFFTRIIFNMVCQPRLMLHAINLRRIKSYWKYMRLEGMEGVKKRYEEVLEIERLRL